MVGQVVLPKLSTRSASSMLRTNDKPDGNDVDVQSSGSGLSDEKAGKVDVDQPTFCVAFIGIEGMPNTA